ncbi:rod shape-determining protein RodA [bacterium]|nr:rod shape-determining protein RodA [bacterium]
MIPNLGRSWRNFDWAMFLGVVGILAIGVTSISSVNHGDAIRQLINLVPAVIAMTFFILYGYDWLDGKAAWVIYAITIIMLIAVDVTGHSALGAQRWLSIGPLKIQPSEYAKFGLIVSLAKVLSAKNIHSPEGFLSSLAVVGFPALLIFKQPDLGTSLVFAAITMGMLFWAGLSVSTLFKMVSPVISLIICMPFVLFDDPAVHQASMGVAALYLLGLGVWLYFQRRHHWILSVGIWLANLGAGLAVPLAWQILKEYQKNRIRTFINPEADPLGTGYHVIQSMIAVGSGGLFGKGLFHGTQTQLHFIPEQHTDFIFSVVGEELGFFAGAGLLALYCLVLVRGLIVANRAKDKFGSLLAIGVVSMLTFHLFVNMGMATGMMPVVGIPLPLMSYGGTALMTNLAAIGLLQSISMRHKKLLF